MEFVLGICKFILLLASIKLIAYIVTCIITAFRFKV